MLKWNDVLNLARNGNLPPERKVAKTDAEWRAQLSPDEYRVTRQAGTERPFSSAMCSLFEPGIYSCVCCDTVLFDASEKFESHTGWPFLYTASPGQRDRLRPGHQLRDDARRNELQYL